MKNKKLYVLLVFAALALASPCQAQHRGTSRQHNSTPQQALDKRQDAFQGDKAKECMLATSGSSVVPTEATGG